LLRKWVLVVTHTSSDARRLRLDLRGFVQGVGFRPFVYRLAGDEGLGGFVRNTGDGVTIEVEGPQSSLRRFLARLDSELPPQAVIHERKSTPLAPCGDSGFAVSPSADGGAHSALAMPDLAICEACLREIFDPADRRYRYPFTTCMHCGPRFSILRALPYDRERTAMQRFALCDACRAEYESPASRRFHAESIACPDCGPQLALWDGEGCVPSRKDTALLDAADALRRGAILALKGLGGFQLLVDASDADAVARLRTRKRRPRKPFALMAPSLASAEIIAELSDVERALLVSREAPIVLLRARRDVSLAPGIAPGNPNLGIMLPTTPLHHLLLREFGRPVVATSGNVGGEPIAVDEHEAVLRLGGIADMYLVHDRPILHAVDDSVVRMIAGQAVVLRRARGYVPATIDYPGVKRPVLALGGQQKNAVAIGHGGKIVLGPHIGDLSTLQAREACDRSAAQLCALHGVSPSAVACDAHPDYYTSRAAARHGLAVARVPHHLAHVLSCMADTGIEAPVLGIAWDGTGYGGDGTVWGGEFLLVRQDCYQRLAHFLPFPLPGGEAAVREPRRAAFGIRHALYGDTLSAEPDSTATGQYSPKEREMLRTMLRRRLNSPLTSSVGRLFDAAASLLDLMQTASFEGEAAMAVEFAAERAPCTAPLPAPWLVAADDRLVLDWRPTLSALIRGVADGMKAEALAAGLHEALARAIVAVAERAGIADVVLTGGCFQNARLTECAVRELRAAGFRPSWHRRIPPNDGGLAAGQVVFAASCLDEVM
jgi:hydrogenase maturation protein HypF